MVPELITRSDESSSGDVAEVNKKLLKFCKQQDWTVIRLNNIHQTDLNKGPLHLNERGTSRMFNNFVDKLGRVFHRPLRHLYNGNLDCSLENLYFYEFLPSKQGFKLAALNINSLIAHIDEFRVLIADRPIDVQAMNETKDFWI